MWPLPPKNTEQVTITICPQQLTCSWIIPSTKHAPLQLMAYHKTSLHHLEFEKLILFNPTYIQKIITSFLAAYQLHNPIITCAITGPSIRERLVTCTNAHPTDRELSILRTSHWHWQRCYLYPHDNGSFVFYVCGIPQPLVLQYQLLAITGAYTIKKITTERAALFALYRSVWANAFRHSQLALHMAAHNNMIEQLFTPDTLKRLLHIPDGYSTQPQKALLPLLVSCGLFLSERYTDEQA